MALFGPNFCPKTKFLIQVYLVNSKIKNIHFTFLVSFISFREKSQIIVPNFYHSV